MILRASVGCRLSAPNRAASSVEQHLRNLTPSLWYPPLLAGLEKNYDKIHFYINTIEAGRATGSQGDSICSQVDWANPATRSLTKYGIWPRAFQGGAEGITLLLEFKLDFDNIYTYYSKHALKLIITDGAGPAP